MKLRDQRQRTGHVRRHNSTHKVVGKVFYPVAVHWFVDASVVVYEHRVVVGERYDGHPEVVYVGGCAAHVSLTVSSRLPTVLHIEERRLKLHAVAVERIGELANLCGLAMNVALIVAIGAAR